MLETMPISEKLKMLRGRRGLTLDELAEQTGLSRSALSNYETNESKEVSQFALVALAKFYGVSTDYLLGLSALENPMQGDIHDLNISSEMAKLLKSGKINNRLLCEMATHPDFPKLLMDMEIMVDGEARNAIRAIDMLRPLPEQSTREWDAIRRLKIFAKKQQRKYGKQGHHHRECRF